MPYFRADDRVRLCYEEHGSGSPLVLAYGIGGHAGMWDTSTPALAARHRVILWEPRGHGRSLRHFANRDQPEAWNRAVLDFLARCEGRSRRRRA